MFIRRRCQQVRHVRKEPWPETERWLISVSGDIQHDGHAPHLRPGVLALATRFPR
jgi:hypothetical protein